MRSLSLIFSNSDLKANIYRLITFLTLHVTFAKELIA